MIVLINKLLVLVFTTWLIYPTGYVVIKYVGDYQNFNKKTLYLLIPLILRFLFDYRSGALCCDSTESSSTGSGTCSWHEGVCAWEYTIYTSELDSEFINFLAGSNAEYHVGTWRRFFVFDENNEDLFRE
jgi:hypothetical protein